MTETTEVLWRLAVAAEAAEQEGSDNEARGLRSKFSRQLHSFQQNGASSESRRWSRVCLEAGLAQRAEKT